MINEYIIFYGYDVTKLAAYIDNWVDTNSIRTDDVLLEFTYSGYSETPGYIGKVLTPFNRSNNLVDPTVLILSQEEKQSIKNKCLLLFGKIIESLTNDKDMFESDSDFDDAIREITTISVTEPMLQWISVV
jgi:hypothetical protein